MDDLFKSSWSHKWTQELVKHFECGSFCICDNAAKLCVGFGCECSGKFESWEIRLKEFKGFHVSLRNAFEDLRKKTVTHKSTIENTFTNTNTVNYTIPMIDPEIQREIDLIDLKLRRQMSPVRRKKLREKRAYLCKRLNGKTDDPHN